MCDIATKDKFATDQAYKRYLYAVELGRKINYFYKHDFLIFHEHDIMPIEIKFIDEHGFPAMDIYADGGNYSLITFAWDVVHDILTIEESKKDIKKQFDKFTLINPKHIKGLFELTGSKGE